MNKFFFLIVGAMFSCGILNAQNEVLDKIVAIVGSEILLQSELDENIALMEAQQGGLPEGAECFIFDQLLSQKLLTNQAKLDSLEVSDVEVTAQLDARFDRILTMMGGDTKQFEEYYGMSISEVREKYRQDLKDQILSQRMRGKVINSATITPSEVLSFYNQIPKDSLPYFNSEVEIGEIVHFPEPSESEMERVRQEAEKIRKQIVEGGADFAKIAEETSDDTGSARLGGNLGWQKRGGFVMEFEAAAFKLKPGEISQVIETEFGFHIIQLIERLGNRINTRHILKTPFVMDADMKRAQAHLDSIRMLVEVDSFTFSQAVRKFSTEKAQSYYNDGLMINANNGNSFFETGDLDPEVYFTIDTMKVGQVSSPILYTTERGDRAFRLVKLVSMTEPHQASLQTDYSKIKAAALEQKKVTYLNEWVSETISNTYVRVDEKYRDCEIMKRWFSQADKTSNQ